MRRFTDSAVAVFAIAILLFASASQAAAFQAGFAKVDITPQKPTPMWGYGDRKDALSTGTLDPLYAKALVIQAGGDKVALVGLDMGRSPTEAMMGRIRTAVKDTSGVGYLMIVGSHTHYGPVIELLDKDGMGKGRFDDAVAYASEFERKVTDVINQAAGKMQDVRIGWGSKEVGYNRNRHWKAEPKPMDKELAVIRIDDLSGKPLAVVVNFAAHPTSLAPSQLLFSAEYPGQMMNAVESALSTNCLFMQGASGDMSTEKRGNDSIEAFGKVLAAEVLEVAKGIETSVPAKPSIAGMDDRMSFVSRIDLHNPAVQALFKEAFFPELMAMIEEFPGNEIPAQLTTILINGQLALVGGSGEFFCTHSNRLKAQSPAEETLFFGYCNGHHMYFPTVAATEQGGYGADPQVSWVAVGAGEQMIDKALANIEKLTGKAIVQGAR
jgi:neutral ceramidase